MTDQTKRFAKLRGLSSAVLVAGAISAFTLSGCTPSDSTRDSSNMTQKSCSGQKQCGGDKKSCSAEKKCASNKKSCSGEKKCAGDKKSCSGEKKCGGGK